MKVISKEPYQKEQRELDSIQQWFIDNDYKINKIVTGEWSTLDSRWTDYLDERNRKRKRQDELNLLLNN